MSASTPQQTAVARPFTITVAFWCLVASIVVAVVSTAIAVAGQLSPTGTAALADSIRQTPGALDGELDVDTLVTIAQATSVGMQVLLAAISLGITLWVAFAVRAGRGYIRIVASVLLALQLVGFITGPSVAGVIALLLVSAAVTAMWLPTSSGYFLAAAERRRGRVDARRHPSPQPASVR